MFINYEEGIKRFKELTIEKAYIEVDDSFNKIGKSDYYVKRYEDETQIDCELFYNDTSFGVAAYFRPNNSQITTFFTYNQEECPCMKKTIEYINRVSKFSVVYEQDDPVVFSVTASFDDLSELEEQLNGVVNFTKAIELILSECLNLDDFDFESQPKLCEYLKSNVPLFALYDSLIKNHSYEDCSFNVDDCKDSADKTGEFYIAFSNDRTDFIAYEKDGQYKIANFIGLYHLDNSKVKEVAEAIADAKLTDPDYDECCELLVERIFTCDSEDYLDHCDVYKDHNLSHDDLLAKYVVSCNEFLLEEVDEYLEDEFDAFM